MQVSMHLLKSGLSRYVARARAGETIEVTSHDKPVARIVGIPSAQTPGTARLLSTGAATWAGGKPGFASPVELESVGTMPSRMVLEGRG